MPDWPIAETWEVSDADGYQSEVTDGPLAGTTLRRLVAEHPRQVVGRGWPGLRFPLLTEFINASGPLPVHLHADDTAPRCPTTSGTPTSKRCCRRLTPSRVRIRPGPEGSRR